MSGLLRSARPSIVALLATSLVLGVNGFVGAIHSVHHLPTPLESHVHAAHDRGHDAGRGQRDPAPAGSPDTGCPVAAAALHLAAAEVAALPALDPSPAERELAVSMPQDAPRQISREPGTGRAPPSVRSLDS